MSLFRKLGLKNKPPAPSHGSRDADNKSASTHQPPPYQPMAPTQPQGSASSYYGSSPMPQYPPVAGLSSSIQQPPYNQYQQQSPNPLVNRNTLPLPTTNPPPGGDDPYSFLELFDTVILVDDSGSMSGSRWNQCAQALATIVPIVTYYDKDGIDLHFLNTPFHRTHQNIKTPSHVMEVFSSVNPRGATPTGGAIKRILKPYMEEYQKNREKKKMNLIIITDGVPTDDPESVIALYAKRLDFLDADLDQIGIQFFQIGDDPSATEALKELDDALGAREDVRDMVDTVPWRGNLQGDYMLKVVLGAVNRRLDRKKG